VIPAIKCRRTFRLLTGRKPTAKEMRILQKLRDEQLALFRADKSGAEAALKIGESAIDPKLDRAELAAAAAVASAVMNFDEAILKR
jgi:Tfp pilus assembly protein PilX